MPKTMIWAWIRNFIGSEPSLETKVLCLPQIQTGKEANIMFKLNGRLGRLLLNPSPSLLLMIQSHVQHMPKNDLLALEAWHRFRSLAKKDKVLARAIRQIKIRQVKRSQAYMFGYLIPRSYMEAMQFDSENKNSEWYDASKLEMESMLEYKVFKKWDKAILDKHKKVKNPPKGYHYL